MRVDQFFNKILVILYIIKVLKCHVDLTIINLKSNLERASQIIHDLIVGIIEKKKEKALVIYWRDKRREQQLGSIGDNDYSPFTSLTRAKYVHTKVPELRSCLRWCGGQLASHTLYSEKREREKRCVASKGIYMCVCMYIDARLRKRTFRDSPSLPINTHLADAHARMPLPPSLFRCCRCCCCRRSLLLLLAYFFDMLSR